MCATSNGNTQRAVLVSVFHTAVSHACFFISFSFSIPGFYGCNSPFVFLALCEDVTVCSAVKITLCFCFADVNECVTNTHTCQADERCVNTVGGFDCERQILCSSGYQLRNGVCEGGYNINKCSHVHTHKTLISLRVHREHCFINSNRPRVMSTWTLLLHEIKSAEKWQRSNSPPAIGAIRWCIWTKSITNGLPSLSESSSSHYWADLGPVSSSSKHSTVTTAEKNQKTLH